MALAFKIAWRNLWRHKGKSFVIGMILFCGAVLMTAGNGMISGMDRGFSANIVNLFTGDIVVISGDQEKDTVLLDTTSWKPLNVIRNFAAARKVISGEPGVGRFLPATAGIVFVLNSSSEMGTVMLLGVDIAQYRRMFPGSIQVAEGRMLNPGEPGILISTEARKQIYDNMNFWVVPEGRTVDSRKLPADVLKNLHYLDLRKDLVFMGSSNSNAATDVRVPVKGIIQYQALNKVWGNYCIVDIKSFREAHNYLSGADSQVAISKEEKQLLANDNLDQLFAAGNGISQMGDGAANISAQEIQAATQRKEGVRASQYNPDAGSFNLVFIKLQSGVAPDQALQRINHEFKIQHLNARAVSWKKAVGSIGSMVVMIKAALNAFIMFIFFVAIIVIMNTLSMAAVEQVSELGMMRAIGARKEFLGKMFVAETGILAFFFGGLGIAAGVILIYLVKAAGISTANEILQLVYGGDQLSPVFTVPDLFLGIIELAIVSFLSVLYPLRVVGKITPLDAIAKD